LPYFGLDLLRLGLYVGFENILGDILVADPAKYKSISVSKETYDKVVEMAKTSRRNISQQLSLIVDDAYTETGFIAQPVREKTTRIYSGGLSAVIED
jgi:hypothetical protein